MQLKKYISLIISGIVVLSAGIFSIENNLETGAGKNESAKIETIQELSELLSGVHLGDASMVFNPHEWIEMQSGLSLKSEREFTLTVRSNGTSVYQGTRYGKFGEFSTEIEHDCSDNVVEELTCYLSENAQYYVLEGSRTEKVGENVSSNVMASESDTRCLIDYKIEVYREAEQSWVRVSKYDIDCEGFFAEESPISGINFEDFLFGEWILLEDAREAGFDYNSCGGKAFAYLSSLKYIFGMDMEEEYQISDQETLTFDCNESLYRVHYSYSEDFKESDEYVGLYTFFDLHSFTDANAAENWIIDLTEVEKPKVFLSASIGYGEKNERGKAWSEIYISNIDNTVVKKPQGLPEK